MQRDLKKRRTSAEKEIKKNSMPFIGHNKSGVKGKTMVEKQPHNLIEESFSKLDEQNEEEIEDNNKKENDNQNDKKPIEKVK